MSTWAKSSSFQSSLHLFHLFSGNPNAVAITRRGGVSRLAATPPRHPQCALQNHLQAVQDHTVPFLLQGRPAAFDRIVLAVVGRIQIKRNSNPDQSANCTIRLRNWVRRPSLWTVVQIDHQAFDVSVECPNGCHHIGKASAQTSLVPATRRTGSTLPPPPSGYRRGPVSPWRADRDPIPR